MGRVRRSMTVEGQECWTLFDSGSRHTYVTARVGELLGIKELREAIPVSLGGSVHEVNRVAHLIAYIDGNIITTDARVVEQIGRDEDERDVEILFGALAMQGWGIGLDLDNEQLDMSRYSKEFMEF